MTHDIDAVIERCANIAYVEAVKHCSARNGMTYIGHPVGHSIAAAIRILKGTIPAPSPAPESAEPVAWIDPEELKRAIAAKGARSIVGGLYRLHPVKEFEDDAPLYAAPAPQAGKTEAIEALKPFAWVGQWLFARDLPDDTPVVTIEGVGSPVTLTRGMFKAAHAALRANGGQP